MHLVEVTPKPAILLTQRGVIQPSTCAIQIASQLVVLLAQSGSIPGATRVIQIAPQLPILVIQILSPRFPLGIVTLQIRVGLAQIRMLLL
ncbi:hypothetical protein PF010_g6548 [Phytophthora fragariae]|uniref:Uncharacterized protein n=1 Tax=Phytophthora fragariae TaxID=53985 RepID=A0A6A3PWH1_9STRA|nr:hypothetical protein PF009_g30349 [Phytophthora fragariae]KAE9061593.1 hypothetical protein PF007_g30203 [Phytophthora fragariae]KAE9070382.1 hypothetical protein PF006_g29370 [Phytophthora fragariae]KAE9123027.1 hypothetical protein PF010_g6548 [Phytophthora fragariae]KAE9268836.1 hypothetical protein PF001_g29490 [Phytophthora fragariae]